MKHAWVSRSKGMSLLYRCVIFFAWFFCKVLYRHKVYGQEHFFQGGAVIASNHTSFLDPILISSSCPEEVHFLARDTLFDHWGFGGLIRALNTHPVGGDGGDVVVFRMICGLIKEGNKVVLFPEGTRSFEDALGKIKPGIGLILSRSGGAIIPTYIHGAYDVWNRRRKLPKLWGKTACVFGSPIQYQLFSHLEKREAQHAIGEKLTQALQALRSWYEAGAKGSPP